MKEEKAVKKTSPSEMTLLPPHPAACQECGRKHLEDEPHDPNSLYYQVAFHRKHGRYPDFLDAMEHCSYQTKAIWAKSFHEVYKLSGCTEKRKQAEEALIQLKRDPSIKGLVEILGEDPEVKPPRKRKTSEETSEETKKETK